MLVTLTGPSCAGKSTLEGYLKKRGFASLISTTTRSPRSGELNSESYFFISPYEFEWRKSVNRFVEHTEFNGNFYGLEKLEVERKVAEGCPPAVLVVEPTGLAQIRSYVEKKGIPLLSVFVSNPNVVIWDRLLRRTIRDYNSVLSCEGRNDIIHRAAMRVESIRTVEQEWVDHAFSRHQALYDVVLSVFDKNNEGEVVDLIVNVATGNSPAPEPTEVPSFLLKVA